MMNTKTKILILISVIFGFALGRIDSNTAENLDPVFSKFKPFKEFIQNSFNPSRDIASDSEEELLAPPTLENLEVQKELSKLGFESEFKKTKKGKTALKVQTPKKRDLNKEEDSSQKLSSELTMPVGQKTFNENEVVNDQIDWMVSGSKEGDDDSLGEKAIDLTNEYKK